ncbi:MAG: STAS domain-containing protein [Chloroflexi bacterium]|nr:STAS domain-containing protein [Chloroflexota bacterium]
MALSLEQVGEVTIVVADGPHLDASAADGFKRDIVPLLESQKKVLLDMSRLSFVDSTGLGTILSCVRKIGAAGGELKLCSMSRPVHSVFELTRMHRIIDILPDRDTGIRAFQ